MTKRKLPLSHFLSLPSTSKLFLVLFLFFVLLEFPSQLQVKLRGSFSWLIYSVLWQVRKWQSLHCLFLVLILFVLEFLEIHKMNQIALRNFVFIFYLNACLFATTPFIGTSFITWISRFNFLPTTGNGNIPLNYFPCELFHVMMYR